MTAAPSLLSRDVARRDCLDHLALPRLGLRARLSEANWTLKSLQSRSLMSRWENQDLETKRELQVTGQTLGSTWLTIFSLSTKNQR